MNLADIAAMNWNQLQNGSISAERLYSDEYFEALAYGKGLHIGRERERLKSETESKAKDAVKRGGFSGCSGPYLKKQSLLERGMDLKRK